MNKVCVVGCGNVGMAYAHELALKAHFVENITLIDIDTEKIKGEALDLIHTMAFSDNYIDVKCGTYQSCKDASLVVITAGKNQKKGGETRQELIKINAGIIKNIISEVEQSGFKGIYLVASNPVDVLTYIIVKECGISKTRVIGSGTVLDTARLKCVIGASLNINPRSVNAFVLGEHGDSEFVAWSVADISGVKLDENLAEKSKNKIEKDVVSSAYNIIQTKGYTNYGVGSCLYALTKAILCNENEVFTVSTYHAKDDCCYSMPAIIGVNGVVNKLTLNLSDKEKAKLKKSINSLKKCYKDYSN